ncbi:hypothetical protein B0A48_11180 [Cryoendolithus antarcticus]|uniref:Topoisomerase I damage affected protein 2 n=1 Tax=Cryoendolithus antarcticus TaxID=1507870 RepID=A0A1V8SUN7_9PEZI|nr:hypothetical protein B0A48_11180 [Cryoendolithus antarcticus]
MATNSPIPLATLTDLAASACSSALSTATSYTHADTQSQNERIINTLLQSLISATTSSETSEVSTGQYKFAVTSTIIQHLEGREAEGEGKLEKRGMHSASGAYWNSERDGMWSYKWEGGEGRRMDVVW